MSDETVTKKTKSKSTKPRLSWKAVGIIALVVAIAVGGTYGVIRIAQWRNNGAGYAVKLGEQIGVSAATAQKYAHITLQSASEYACINMVAAEYPHLFESPRKTDVMGVTIPEWVIYVGERNDAVTDILYYDYRQLGKFGNGVKRSTQLAIDGITNGMSTEAVHTYADFEPLCITYSAKEMTESYKYYYKDQNTGDTLSYIVKVTYHDGLVTDVKEEENQFILSVLTLD